MGDLRIDIDAEAAVIGAGYASASALALARAIVSAGDFSEESHALVWDALCAMFDAGQPVDRLTLSARLRDLGTHERVASKLDLAELEYAGIGADRVEEHARIVAECGLMRRIRVAATQLVRDTNTAGLSAAMVNARVGELLDLAMRGAAGKEPVSFADLADTFGRKLEEAYARKGQIDGITTGFASLDSVLAGLHGSEFMVIGARPRVGKSSLALQMAIAAARETERPVLGFSLEMTALSLFGRAVHSHARVDATESRMGTLSADSMSRLTAGMNELGKVPVYLDDGSATTVLDIRAKAQAMKARRGLAMVFVDYLQLVETARSRGNRQQEVADMSLALRRLSRDLDVPVVALAQLSRLCEQRPDKRPVLSDLRESGSLEQDADTVLLLYRDVLYDPKTKHPELAEVIIPKARFGAQDVVPLRWEGAYTIFSDYPDGEAPMVGREQEEHASQPKHVARKTAYQRATDGAKQSEEVAVPVIRDGWTPDEPEELDDDHRF